MADTSRLTVGNMDQKLLFDRMLDILTNRKEDKAFLYSSDLVFAVKVPKGEAYETVVKTLSGDKFTLVSLDSNTVYAVADGLFGIFRFTQRSKYSTVYCQLWTGTVEEKKSFNKWLSSVFKDKFLEGRLCGMRWLYNTARGMSSAYLEEILSDEVLDEAYPTITERFGSLQQFADQYLNSDESVLLLQGPPGTGKSRLIRYLMSRLTEIKNVDIETHNEYGESMGAQAKSLVMYTTDADSLKGDELFAHFMNSEEIMFVVEDADLLLKSRASGNDHLHRFLTVSDGIIRNVGRKVVFTTNLPNLSDVDEALVRPGRCFGAFSLGGMRKPDALKFADKLSNSHKGVLADVERFFEKERSMSLAHIYKVWKSQNK